MRTSLHSICLLLAAGLLIAGQTGCSPQAKKAGHLQKADRFYAAGEYDKAEIEYLNVLQIERLDPQAIGQLALIYFDQGRPSRVMPFLLKGRELQPENLELRLKLGLVALSAGQLKAARDEANFILDRKPLDAEAPLLLAEATTTKPEEIEASKQRLLHLPAPATEGAPVLLALGTLEFKQRHLPEAEAAFRRALTKDPQSSAAQAAIGTWYWTQKNLPEAEQAFKRATELAPARSPRGLLYAKFKIQNGDRAAGRKALEEMTRKTPDYLPAWILLAELAAAEKKYPESAACLAKVLALDATHPEALLLSGRLDLVQGENKKAVAAMEKMLKAYPQSPQAHFQLGQAHQRSGDAAKAVASLTQAVTLAPGFTEANIFLAEINLRSGESGKAISTLQAFIKLRPDFPQGRFLLADAHRAHGDLNEALAIYRQLEEMLPRDPQPPHWQGSVLVQQNKRDEARLAFAKALSLAPDFLLSLNELVALDLAEKNYAAAQQRVEKQIARDPKQAGPYLLQARVSLAQKDTAQAESALRKVIELQPESPTAYLMLARLYASSNQLDKALTNFQTVADKNPRSVEALMMIATIHDQQKNFPAAREAYEKLLLISPQFTAALNNLAYLYAERFNELDKAQLLAKKARELLPNEPHLADTLGWILYKQGQFSWAADLLQESVAKLPDSAEIQFHLGMTHYMLGEEAPARRALERALQLDKGFPGNDEAGQRLSVLAIDPKTAGAGEIAALEKRIAERPGDPVALVRLAAMYAKKGNKDKALATYEAALRASPKNVSAMIELSRLLAAQGEKTKAIDLAKSARKLAPDDSEVTQTLGRLAYQTGDYPWAYSLLHEAAGKNPADPELQFDLAEAAYSVGRVAEAEAAMQRVIATGALLPQANEARRFLKLTALAASPALAADGGAQIEEALKANPASVPALLAQAAMNEQKGERAGAQSIYEKVLGLYPDFSPAKKRLVILYSIDPSKDQKAFDLALKAREIFPEDAELTKAFGIILYRRGDFSRAAGLLKESTAQRRDDAELLYYLGAAQHQLKQLSESRQSLQRAIELGLKPDLAAEARRRLAEIK